MTYYPRVSIVIPVYNGADFLRQAIDSALGQTYRNVEVIVINDGSTDGGKTEAIARSFGERIRYFAKTNGGVASALNLGVERMAGEFFSWLSHDDLYLPDKVASQVDFLSAAGAHRIAYSDYKVLYPSGREEVVTMCDVPANRFRYFLTEDSSLHGCTLLVPRRCFAECGDFDETLRTTQDYDMWFRLAARYEFRRLPRAVVVSRSHPNQGSRRMLDIARREANSLLTGFVDRLTEAEVGGRQNALASGYADIAASAARRGYAGAGKHAFRLALQNTPAARARDWPALVLKFARISCSLALRPLLRRASFMLRSRTP